MMYCPDRGLRRSTALIEDWVICKDIYVLILIDFLVE